MSRSSGGHPGLGAEDPLDARFGHAPPEPEAAHRARVFDRRLALGLSPTPVLGLFVLLLGIALGPHGLNLLSPPVLSHLDPAASVALAALGVLVGLGFDVRGPRQGRLLAAASLEAGLTMLLVGAGVLLVLSRWPAPMDVTPWLSALLLGVCASASATAATDLSDEFRGPAAHIGDLDDVLPIVIGGLALAWMREGSPGAAVWLTIQASGVALVIALAAWLLVTQASSDSEQHVFALGGLLLLGGAAEYLSLSALVAGFVAGVFWNLAGGSACDRIRRDVNHVQHPLVFVLLVIAGARVGGFTPILVGLVVVYVVLRITGKVAGGWLVRRLIATDLPPQVGLRLMSPGIVGVAFALNALQAGGAGRASLVLAVTVAGSLGSELLSLLVRRIETPA
ncbi:MAG: hypothetical protein HY824_03475 [Acidobacteria bacterium]|nr:hypothetical protein [Acidobacteriota bacterium]